MLCRILRRLGLSMFILAFGAGVFAGGGPTKADGIATDVRLFADAGTPKPDGCPGQDGPGQGGLSAGACSVLCAPGSAMLSATVPASPGRPIAFEAVAPTLADGRRGPPDPDPPRPVALS